MRGDEGVARVGLNRPARRLVNAVKILNQQWAETSPFWKDSARAAFQKEFMDEMFSCSRGGITSMSELENLLTRVIEECS